MDCCPEGGSLLCCTVSDIIAPAFKSLQATQEKGQESIYTAGGRTKGVTSSRDKKTLDKIMVNKKIVEFCALREPLSPPDLSRCSSVTGCRGREANWETPAMCDCWWVFLLSLFFLFVSCLLFPPALGHRDTHFCFSKYITTAKDKTLL